jgi:hypothetical protein
MLRSESAIDFAAISSSSAAPPIPRLPKKLSDRSVIAKRQGARSFGLRAALSLAKLYQSTALPLEAHAVLAPALEGFSPTPEMPEIAEARALLAMLADTEEVKAVEAQRQRRLHLQTAYGEAMKWSKGYAAQETRVALTRAVELAEAAHDFSERFVASGSLFAAMATAGELRPARELASKVLCEAEGAGRVKKPAWPIGGSVWSLIGMGTLLRRGSITSGR